MSASGPVIVIGAGIVGVSTAIWLRRANVDVIVVDRLEPGRGTSFGNAGVLAACSMVPMTVPGLVRAAPRLALDPNSPLFLRWSYLPRLTRWLTRYLRHANDHDARRIAAGLTPLVGDSVAVRQHTGRTVLGGPGLLLRVSRPCCLRGGALRVVAAGRGRF